jgi:hypothetical protein
MAFLMVGALAVFQMASAVVQGTHPMGELGKVVDVVGMLVLLVLAALLPLSCGSWRAAYGHPYIHTRESIADDEDVDPRQEVSPRSRVRCGQGCLLAGLPAPIPVMHLRLRCSLSNMCYCRAASSSTHAVQVQRWMQTPLPYLPLF